MRAKEVARRDVDGTADRKSAGLNSGHPWAGLRSRPHNRAMSAPRRRGKRPFYGAWPNIGPSDKERNARLFFIHRGAMKEAAMVAKLFAVIGSEDDESVVVLTGFIEIRKKALQLVIDAPQFGHISLKHGGTGWYAVIRIVRRMGIKVVHPHEPGTLSLFNQLTAPSVSKREVIPRLSRLAFWYGTSSIQPNPRVIPAPLAEKTHRE